MSVNPIHVQGDILRKYVMNEGDSFNAQHSV